MKMTYEAASDALRAAVCPGMVPGLESITKLLEQLQRPDRKLDVIHVAGTNGKGSVNAYLDAILRQAGYRVGRYSSPVVFDAREQFQVNGMRMSAEEYVTEAEVVLSALAQMRRDEQDLPTMFEVETAMAFSYFNRKRCDLVLLETGMGGRLDATNVVERPKLCVFTPVSMDHMEMLGDTLGQIAEQKAGILKLGTCAVSAMQATTVMQVLEARCRELKVPLRMTDPGALKINHTGRSSQVFSYKGYERLEIQMTGHYQIENAILAIEAVFQLQEQGCHITEAHIRSGLRAMTWPGRLEQIGRRPDVYIDGAHNIMAALALARFLEEITRKQELILILGIFKDKEYTSIVKILGPYAKQVITTAAPGEERALAAEELQRECQECGFPSRAADSPQEALKLAYQLAKEEDIIVAAGSLSYLKYIKQAMNE